MRNDPAHRATDRIIKDIEKELAKEYRQAQDEITEKFNEHIRKYKVKDRIWRKWVADGKKTREEYKAWVTGQIMTGKRWDDLRNAMANDCLNAHKTAQRIVNGKRADVYAENHNYATYQLEHMAKVDTSYTLYDRDTVERMYRENPKLYPDPGRKTSQAIQDGKILAWNKKQIQSVLMQGILQGESIPNLTKRLERVTGGEHKAAIRNARTMMTGIQNAGRLDGFKRGEEMGINCKKQWIATIDSRTRHWHRQLDGVKTDLDKPFENDIGKIMFPGDPTADGANIYNCRCTMICAMDRHEIDISKFRGSYNDGYGTMSYEEWKADKIAHPLPITHQEDVSNDFRNWWINQYRGFPSSDDNITPVVPSAPAASKPQTLESQTDFNGMKEYFNNAHGIRIDDSVGQLDFNHVKAAMAGIDDAVNAYPVLRKQIRGIGTYSSGYMCSDGSKVMFNPQYFTSGKAFTDNVAYQAGAHEVGHCLDMLICRKEGFKTEKKVWPDIADVWDNRINIGARMDWNSNVQAKKIVTAAIRSVKKSHPEFSNMSARELRGSISYYALKDTSETLAEAVGNHTLLRNRGVNRNINKEAGAALCEEIVSIIEKGIGDIQ